VLELVAELYASRRTAPPTMIAAAFASSTHAISFAAYKRGRCSSKPCLEARSAKAIAYMGDLWPGLLRFLDAPRLALDNNATERALRGVVHGRVNYLFFGNENAGHDFAVLYTRHVKIVPTRRTP
jgi:transposase